MRRLSKGQVNILYQAHKRRGMIGPFHRVSPAGEGLCRRGLARRGAHWGSRWYYFLTARGKRVAADFAHPLRVMEAIARLKETVVNGWR